LTRALTRPSVVGQQMRARLVPASRVRSSRPPGHDIAQSRWRFDQLTFDVLVLYSAGSSTKGFSVASGAIAIKHATVAKLLTAHFEPGYFSIMASSQIGFQHVQEGLFTISPLCKCSFCSKSIAALPGRLGCESRTATIDVAQKGNQPFATVLMGRKNFKGPLEADVRQRHTRAEISLTTVDQL
jgi:hypothetical protein